MARFYRKKGLRKFDSKGRPKHFGFPCAAGFQNPDEAKQFQDNSGGCEKCSRYCQKEDDVCYGSVIEKKKRETTSPKPKLVEVPSSTHEFNIGAEVEVVGTKEFVVEKT